MPMNEREFFKQTLITHLNLGRHKAVSYLPISTVVNVLKCDLNELVKLGSNFGLGRTLTSAERSCVRSGSLHFYDSGILGQMLGDRGWKSDILPKRRARIFVRRIARTWFENDDPIITLIQAAFGDEPHAHCKYVSPSPFLLSKVDEFIYLQTQ